MCVMWLVEQKKPNTDVLRGAISASAVVELDILQFDSPPVHVYWNKDSIAQP